MNSREQSALHRDIQGPARNIEDFARDYIDRGWRRIPIAHGEKRCTLIGWPELVITTEDVPRHFRAGTNIGIILGSRSLELVDIDLDCR